VRIKNVQDKTNLNIKVIWVNTEQTSFVQTLNNFKKIKKVSKNILQKTLMFKLKHSLSLDNEKIFILIDSKKGEFGVIKNKELLMYCVLGFTKNSLMFPDIFKKLNLIAFNFIDVFDSAFKIQTQTLNFKRFDDCFSLKDLDGFMYEHKFVKNIKNNVQQTNVKSHEYIKI
jgi:hypothetical protein